MPHQPQISSNFNVTFWLHLALLLVSWGLPFLVSWWLAVLVYLLVFLQFLVFKRCVMNSAHGLDEGENNDATFYSFLLEQVGIKHNRRKVKQFVRSQLLIILSLISIIWQVILNFKPILFFK